MGQKKSSKLAEVVEEAEDEEEGGAEDEDSGRSEFEVDDDEEDSDDPDFSETRKRKRCGSSGGGMKAARSKKKKPLSAATASFSSSYRGVTHVPATRRWQAQFWHNSTQTSLGTFKTEEGAARVYDRMAVWCYLHGLVKKGRGGKGGWHTSSSYREDLNFDNAEYEGELQQLGRMTQEELVMQLRRGEGTRVPTSEFRGVSWKPRNRRWEARFNHNLKNTSLGYFETEEDAARAFDRMLVWCELNGEERRPAHSKLNFPRADYEGESEELRGITMDKMVQKLRHHQAREQRVVANNMEGVEVGAGADAGRRGAELAGVEEGDVKGVAEDEGEGNGASASHPSALPLVGVGASGVTHIKVEEEEETLGQLRDRLGLGPGAARVPAPGPRAVSVHIKVEDTTSGDDMDGQGVGDGGGGNERGRG